MQKASILGKKMFFLLLISVSGNVNTKDYENLLLEID